MCFARPSRTPPIVTTLAWKLFPGTCEGSTHPLRMTHSVTTQPVLKEMLLFQAGYESQFIQAQKEAESQASKTVWSKCCKPECRCTGALLVVPCPDFTNITNALQLSIALLLGKAACCLQIHADCMHAAPAWLAKYDMNAAHRFLLTPKHHLTRGQ